MSVNIVFRWFCHFDDDTYVNVDLLLLMLANYRHNEDWYLGRPSLSTKLQITNFEQPGVSGRMNQMNHFNSVNNMNNYVLLTW